MKLGFGMDFYLQYFKLGIEFKYSVGLTDVLKTRIRKKDEPGGYYILRRKMPFILPLSTG